jgi:hypothetical protein
MSQLGQRQAIGNISRQAGSLNSWRSRPPPKFGELSPFVDVARCATRAAYALQVKSAAGALLINSARSDCL